MPMMKLFGDSAAAFKGYIASPSGPGPFPGLVLIHEIYGVNRFIRRIADSWAERGFLTVAPDFYWRVGEGIELDPEVEGHRDLAMATRQRVEAGQTVADLGLAIDRLAADERCNGHVATIGYCFGGLITLLAASAGHGTAHVSYYGVGMDAYPEEAARILLPLMLHFGETDPLIPEEARLTVAQAVAETPATTIFTYPYAGHAFAREGASTDLPAARDAANARTEAFLRQHLA